MLPFGIEISHNALPSGALSHVENVVTALVIGQPLTHPFQCDPRMEPHWHIYGRRASRRLSASRTNAVGFRFNLEIRERRNLGCSRLVLFRAGLSQMIA